MRRILAELALGVRLAFPSGRRGWLRTAMASAGVALGAAALLLGASVPVMLDAREARIVQRADSVGAQEVPAGRTLIVAGVDAQWGSNAVRGRLIWPDSPEAPLPPGVPAFPADHQMYASPALQEALSGPDGATLRRQMPYEVVGTIAPSGLSGPHEFAYYAGYERAKDLVGTGSWRVDRFGYAQEDEPGPGTYVVIAAMLATLLLPIAIFIGAALRFGADARDRRLAAIRLVGADGRAVLRIALGESLVPAGLGLAAGTVLYLMVRGRAADLWLFDVSVFPADIRPVPVLALLVVVVVLALSAGLTLLGFRGVAVEPLGVFRRSTTWNGRLWWRLLPLAAGLWLLWPVLTGASDPDEERAGLGVVLMVVALIPLVPYLVPLAARVLPGGSASWQLASQQLRQNPAASTRAVTGIVVAVTGAIALHAFFGAASLRRETPDNPHDPAYVLQAPGRQTTTAMRERTARFETVDGIRAGTVAKYTLYGSLESMGSAYLVVGDCTALAQIATFDRCADGDAFVVGDLGRAVTLDAGKLQPVRGTKVPVPPRARPARFIGTDAQNIDLGLLLTSAPAALATVEPWFVETRMFASDDAPDTAAGQLRGLAAEIDPLAQFTALAPESDKYASLRIALNLGSAVILLMMGVGLLLDVASRLHDRRRLLGVLAAVGARRSTVIWSVLLQAFVPVLAGLALAIVAGAGLGSVLMLIARVPVALDLAAVLTPVAVGSALVLGTTLAVLLPAARRFTSTEELRYE
ncbi:membrane protein [Paractinoplanes abujensis]|uniref:ABC3 transporter permease C-terminal domain-containing protein n=1 Tax=Paractinoplanes abujensis TaxID=882441 RepID=A0A7W7CYB3_9ACTN|nr:FtsX-like permease family protein [Actinoplanes abujensis]MBB4696868.1 hypothetical protein [Actinoplanes abujensis]GID18664.1 membrane protein [Actinoplanes abujensis]